MTPLTPVNCQYGAPTGRNGRDINNAGPVKLHLHQVPLDSGGYDSGGAYWGLRSFGMHLYRYYWESRNNTLLIENFIDARNRDEAKAIIQETYPDATFYC